MVKIGIEVRDLVVTDPEIDPGVEVSGRLPESTTVGNTADHAALIAGGSAGSGGKVCCCCAHSLHPVVKADRLA